MKGMSWVHLCSLDVPYFFTLIKKFYNTLAIRENVLYAIVRKITINVIEEILRHIFQISTTGLIDLCFENREDTVHMIVGENSRYTNGELLAN